MSTPNFEGRELTQQECYQAGYEQGKRDAAPEHVRKDAERWRWVSQCTSFEDGLAMQWDSNKSLTDFVDNKLAIAAAPKGK